MDASIPSAAEVQARLSQLSRKELKALADVSGVAESTLIKVRYGTTKDPGIETVRQFWPHVQPPAPNPRPADAQPLSQEG